MAAPYGAAPYVLRTWISLRDVSSGSWWRYSGVTDSSVSGVIFFSSTSSSAKFFLYFSQLEPVAEG
jgi:hypothetical protein